MSLPGFEYAKKLSSDNLCLLIADRVRFERRRQKCSQFEFAAACQVPLRTYKRFELGKCDSLAVFIRIVIAFDRIAAIELLFPPKTVALESHLPTAALERLLNKLSTYK